MIDLGDGIRSQMANAGAPAFVPGGGGPSVSVGAPAFVPGGAMPAGPQPGAQVNCSIWQFPQFSERHHPSARRRRSPLPAAAASHTYFLI